MKNNSGASNATNAWNVNLNNGNVNNNTKTNTYRVRPVSDIDNERRSVGLDVSITEVFAGLIEADEKCRRGKRNTPGEISFELDAPRRLYRMAKDLIKDSFDPGHCSAFLKSRPVLREIFASQYRARVVQTWAVIRVQPLLEAELDGAMMSNRPGRGTSQARQQALKHTDEYRAGWVASLDFRGFFMSIDKRMANAFWQDLIDRRYEGADKDLLKRVVCDCITRCPQVGCHVQGDRAEWAKLPAHKSLFAQDENHGLVIGDHLSQLTALLVLLRAVRWLRAHGISAMVEYVDDFLLFTDDPDALKRMLPAFRAFVLSELGLTLHPHKFYLQPVRHGWHFIGGKAKPGVLMSSDRTIRHFREAVRRRARLEKYVASVNSYLGLFQEFRAYRVKLAELPQILHRLKGRAFLTGHLDSIKILKRFTRRDGFCRQVRATRCTFKTLAFSTL